MGIHTILIIGYVFNISILSEKLLLNSSNLVDNKHMLPLSADLMPIQIGEVTAQLPEICFAA